MMSIYEYLKEHSNEVMFVDRTGNMLAVYCKNNIKVLFEFNTINTANKKLTKFRRELENKRVG